MHAFSHIICICIAAAAEEVIYEVVAEPPEPLEQAGRGVRTRPRAQWTPVLSSRRKASPGAHPIISNL